MVSDRVKDFFKRMISADDRPADKCAEGKEHNYRVVSHTDSPDHYSWYLECEHCNHMMVRKFERDKAESKMWS